jgi:hypothetical protein
MSSSYRHMNKLSMKFTVRHVISRVEGLLLPSVVYCYKGPARLLLFDPVLQYGSGPSHSGDCDLGLFCLYF